MKSFKKLGALMVSGLMLAGTLVGCTTEDNKLYTAYTADYKSGTMNMDMSVKFNSALPEAIDPTGEFAKMAEAVSLGIAAEYETANKLASKVHMKMDVKGLDTIGLTEEVIGMKPSMEAWVDADLAAGDKMKYQAIYKYPMTDKYVTLDLAKDMKDVLTESGLNLTPDKIQEMTKEIFKEVATTGIKPVEKDGVYTIDINKAQMKEISAKYIDFSMNLQKSMIGETFAGLTAEEKAEAEKAMADAVSMIKELDIYADNAAQVKITLDDKDLIKTMDMVVNFDINIQEIAKKAAKTMGQELSAEDLAAVPAGKIDMTLKLNCTYDKTNQDVKVTLPQLTSDNSMTLEEFMNQSLEGATIEVNEVPEVAPVDPVVK